MLIPSTLNGSNLDPQTGKVDREKHVRNMDLAMYVYLSRVDQSPCGGSPIHLFKGADSSKLQEMRTHLLPFLREQKQKERLKREHRDLHDYFQRVWKIREDHMVKDLPTNYLFFLVCCCKPSCAHPHCKNLGVHATPKC